eukprot:TRINITY_DN3529_c0_g1_i1.p1 TRINITY_DN3529_c0_g1~~TRINITY_DN3529_c0_g1_i1.p1  ORF type:complete len:273 (+),score=99.69 TRINITY_DN3529_c0_g1_i1:542-1360(+)
MKDTKNWDSVEIRWFHPSGKVTENSAHFFKTKKTVIFQGREGRTLDIIKDPQKTKTKSLWNEIWQDAISTRDLFSGKFQDGNFLWNFTADCLSMSPEEWVKGQTYSASTCGKIFLWGPFIASLFFKVVNLVELIENSTITLRILLIKNLSDLDECQSVMSSVKNLTSSIKSFHRRCEIRISDAKPNFEFFRIDDLAFSLQLLGDLGNVGTLGNSAFTLTQKWVDVQEPIFGMKDSEFSAIFKDEWQVSTRVTIHSSQATSKNSIAMEELLKT